MNQGEPGLSTPHITLWQGDCLEEMKRIPDKSVDMVLADLP
jgi:DNA modification methylase